MSHLFEQCYITEATTVVILVPPAAPVTSTTSPFLRIIVGTMEDNGCFFGTI